MAKRQGESENIEMKKEFPNDDLIKSEKEMSDKILSEDREAQIIIWPEQDGDSKLIFMSIGNVTINVSEYQFYALTKQVQIAAKKLLGVD